MDGTEQFHQMAGCLIWICFTDVWYCLWYYFKVAGSTCWKNCETCESDWKSK